MFVLNFSDELGQGPKFGNVIKSRVVPGWKKMHSLQAEVLPKGASIGVRLEDCPPASENEVILLSLVAFLYQA